MSTDLVLVLALLGAAILMFSLNRPRSDAVALLMMVTLPFTGLITINEALAGFADPNIMLIAAHIRHRRGLGGRASRGARRLAGAQGRREPVAADPLLMAAVAGSVR